MNEIKLIWEGKNKTANLIFTWFLAIVLIWLAISLLLLQFLPVSDAYIIMVQCEAGALVGYWGIYLLLKIKNHQVK